jgi:hypothetical protein
MALTSVILAGVALEEQFLPAEIALLRKFFDKVFHHPQKAAAIVAATAAIDTVPDDADTNDPSSPYFVP